LALNTASGTPALFFKDNAGGVVKVGPAHVGGAAPNISPAGSAGNSVGELWVDNGTTIHGLKYYDGSVFVNLTPPGSTTVPGLVELATDAETQTGTDIVRAVTPSGLQSKISDSISTASSTTIASATAVKTAYDLANAALPKSGGSVTGELLIAPSGSLVFEGSTSDGFETTLAVTDPTADRIITLPNTTGTVITTGDTGTVTSTMIADGTILNADINASAAIVDTKLATIATAGKVSNSATTATSVNTAGAIVARDGSGNFTANVITASLNGTASAIADDTVTSAKIVDGSIVNADVNASAAIAGTKISPNFGSQNIVTTGTATASSFLPTGSSVPTNGMYLPATNQLAFSTNGTGRLFVDSSGSVGIGTSSPSYRLDITSADTTASVGYAMRLRANATAGAAAIQFTDNGATAQYGYIACDSSLNLKFATETTERLRIDSSGRVGIGTSSPNYKLDVSGSALIPGHFSSTVDWNFSNLILRRNASNISTAKMLSMMLQGDTDSDTTLTNYLNIWGTYSAAPTTGSTTTGLSGAMNLGAPYAILWHVNGSERVRIENSGNVGIGTSSPGYSLDVVSADTTAGVGHAMRLRANATAGAAAIQFTDNGATAQYGYIACDSSLNLKFVAGTTERIRITSGGYFKASNDGNYFGLTGAYHETYQTADEPTLVARATNATLTNALHYAVASRAANSAYFFFVGTSGYGGTADDEFKLYGDGNGKCDGAWTGGGADYAEYFEWSDGNFSAEDRRGISVVLNGGKIQPALAGEDPIGVISGNPSVVGDAAWNKWSGKYLRDDYGTYIQEDYEVVDDDGNTIIQQRRKLNPVYDSNQEYVSREERPEWGCVGLMGKLRIRKGQPTGSRWIKMRNISDSVEEWLVR
jgi:hypothetical protein